MTKHSRRGFEEVEGNLGQYGGDGNLVESDETMKDAEQNRSLWSKFFNGPMTDENFSDIVDSRRTMLKKQIEALKGDAQKEATKLNQEHEKLIQRLTNAANELMQFEREKLGMHQRDKQN